MSVTEFLLLLLVAAIIGTIGEALAGYSFGGCAMSTVVGFVGSFIGFWLQRQFHMPAFMTVSVGGHNFPIIWSVIGSALLVLALRLILNGRQRGARG